MGWIHTTEGIIVLALYPAQYKALQELGYDYSQTRGATVKEYALSMDVTTRTVYEWLSTKKLKAEKTPGGWRIYGQLSS